MAGPDPKDMLKRLEALEKKNITHDKRWDALGDAHGETNQRLDKFMDSVNKRLAVLEKRDVTHDKRWDAIGDAHGETSQRLDAFQDYTNKRIAELEKKVAALTKK